MNKIVTRIACLAVTGLMALSISSCTTEDSTTNTGTGDGSTTPSGLQFSARNSTSIAVTWTRNTKDAGTDVVTATDATTGTLVATQNAASTQTTPSAVLTGLSPDKTYTIKVMTSNNDAVTGTWATAYRLPGDAGTGGTFRLYETADNTSGHSSGLVLNTSNPHTASTVGSEASSIDLVLGSSFGVIANCPQPCIALTSASVTSLTGIANGHDIKFADNAFSVNGGLDNDFYSAPLSISSTSTTNYIDIATRTTDMSNSLIIPILTADNHYARVEVVPQSNGQLYGIDGDNHYFVDVRVSYQSQLGVGYVGRPNQVRMAGNVMPHAAHIASH